MADTFDYVIVGAGSAGCVLANRLSEDAGTSVCVLEAGPKDWHPYIHLPAGFIKTFHMKGINWAYQQEPGPWTGGRSIYAPRGKTLGGSSSINGHIYNRGQRQDFDTWAQLGNRGWGYPDVLPYFKRLERRVGEGEDTYRGRDGNLTVTTMDWRDPLCEAFMAGAMSLGIPRNPDYNGAIQEGVSYAQRTIQNGLRVSASTAFLRPAMKRPNVHVRTHAHATGIVFDGKRAIGVRYVKGGKSGTPTEVRAAKEVILAGGTYNSPQLLQLSGIGPGELLQQHGIAVVRDLPAVGANLHDHFNTYLVWRCSQPVTINDLAMSAARKVQAGVQYALTRSGHLSNAGIYAGAFVKSDPRLETPDLQINMFGWSALERLRTGIKPHPFSAFTLSPVHLRPEGRGTVRIKSPDPLAPPAIQFNFLASEYDFQALIYGARLARQIAAQPALQPFVVEEVIPGRQCETDEQMKAEIRLRGVSNLHPVGTCRMGRGADCVVDPRLRVYGVEGLRVADASIMPQVPGGNTNAPSIMIGEKCAAMVLEDSQTGDIDRQAA